MLALKFSDLTVTDCIVNKLRNTDEVCCTFSKGFCRAIFEENNFTPTNPEGFHDDSFVEGELQFNFDRQTKDLVEVLLFPVYMVDGMWLNGMDFLNVEVSDEIVNKVREYLK